MNEELVKEALKMSYKELVLERRSLENLLRHYELALKAGLIKDITKYDLGIIVECYKKAVRIKEKEILRNAFLRGRD